MQCSVVADGNPTVTVRPTLSPPPPSTDCLLCFVEMWKCKSQLGANVDNMCYLRLLLIAHRCPAEPLGHPPQIFLPFLSLQRRLPASTQTPRPLNHLLKPPSPRPIKATVVLEQGELTRAPPSQFICSGLAYLRCSL